MFLLFHYTSEQRQVKIWKIKKRNENIFHKVGNKVIIHQKNVFLICSTLPNHFLSVLKIRYRKYPHLNNPKTDLILRQLYIRLFPPFSEKMFALTLIT